jgi:hypothetical protein
VGGYDAPTFRQAHPYLAPAPLTDFAVDGALKFESDAPIVFPERNDIEPPDGARQVGGRAPFAEGFDLLDPIQIFACAKAHGVRRGPKHLRESVNVVRDERLLVFRIERLEFGYRFGIVDAQGLEQPPCGKYVLRHGRTYGIHRLVDDLAELQMERNAAQKIGVNIAETPAVHKQVDHA